MHSSGFRSPRQSKSLPKPGIRAWKSLPMFHTSIHSRQRRPSLPKLPLRWKKTGSGGQHKRQYRCRLLRGEVLGTSFRTLACQPGVGRPEMAGRVHEKVHRHGPVSLMPQRQRDFREDGSRGETRDIFGFAKAIHL